MLMVNSLIGFGGGGRPAISSIVQQASASSTTDTITWPTVAAGDIAVLFDLAESLGSLPTSVTPTGFTNIADSNISGVVRIMTSFKLCDGTETGSLTGMNGDLTDRKAMVTYRATPAAITATHGSVQATITNVNPAAVTVVASGGVAPLIVFGYYHSSGVVDPRTFTVGGSDAKDGEVSFHTNRVYQAWKFYLTSPADVVLDMDDEGNVNTIHGAYIALT